MHPQHYVEKVTSWIGSPPSLLLHTVVFVVFFALSFMRFLSWDLMFLILTTIVSLEAIYLAIFIQMTVNRQARELEQVGEDVDEIQENIDEIQEDIEEITEDEAEAESDKQHVAVLETLTQDVKRLLADLEALKRDKTNP